MTSNDNEQINLDVNDDIGDILKNTDRFVDGDISGGSQLLSNSATLIGGASLLGATAHYGKRAIARGIDTYGFGANVTGSYQGDSKIAQYTNNLLQAGGAKRRNMPIEFMKTLMAKGNPAELSAMENSIAMLDEHMSKLKSQGLRIPKKMKEYYLNLQAMRPERNMAQAILQTSFNQPVNFEHGGKFVKNAMPQVDEDIGKALANKGFDTNKPFTVYDVTDDKFMNKKLRMASTNDPRLRIINQALKNNQVDDAKMFAKNGTIKYGKELIHTGKPINLVKEGDGYVAKFVPQYMQKGGKLASVKEYVVGGHTQRVHFGKYEGFKGFHKTYTDMFDITSYASAGETADNVITKGRIAIAGEQGRKAGVHQPVVTVSSYKHRAPGGGRTPGVVDKVKRKSRKFVEASAKTLYDDPSKLKKLKAKDLLRIAKILVTKGKSF